MITIKDNKMCSGCFACASCCPILCISMLQDSEGFVYPMADEKKCVDCNICEKICPIMNPITTHRESKKAYAAYCTDDEIRIHSSSGGIFTLLAQSVIDNGGVVFGAGFDRNFKVVHKCVRTKEELRGLVGSKYTQSEIGDAYKESQKNLDSGKKVLFTGTPCQISGLISSLKKDYDNLYTQDIICHGVPSPKIFKDYIALRENEYGSKTKNINFRDKKNGWKTFSLAIKYQDNSGYTKSLLNDLYMKAFLSNLSLRPSCYDCAFKGTDRPADITLADFWGIENICPEMDDDKGTSFVLVHSKKGQELFNSVKIRTVYELCDINEAVKNNSAMVMSVKKPQKRDEFFQNLDSADFKKTLKKYTARKPSIIVLKWTKRVLKKVLRK